VFSLCLSVQCRQPRDGLAVENDLAGIWTAEFVSFISKGPSSMAGVFVPVRLLDLRHGFAWLLAAVSDR